jgi:hypothetical protein
MMMDELAVNVIRGLDPRIDPSGRQDVDVEPRRVNARVKPAHDATGAAGAGER